MSSWLRGSWVVLVSMLMVGWAACQWEVPNDPFIDADVDATDPDAGMDGSTDAPTDGMPMATLTVIRGGTASGTVTSNAVGGAMIDCGATCTAQFPPGTLITLTETPGTGATFAGWSGVCTDTSPNCSFTLDSDTTVQATFDVSRHTITIAPGGNGSGSVTSNVGGIACPGVCAATVDHGTSLTLTATPVAPSIFAGWNDVGCTGTTPCTFTVTQDENIDAAFALNYTVTVSKNGNGRGTVTSSSPGIDCGTDCDQVYSAGTMVTLNAAADADSDFLGWGGACTGTGSCLVTVDSVVSVTANFALKRYTLTASRAGSGGGVVTSNPTGINCGTACEAMYDHGTQVTLSAVPDGSSTFSGWSDASCPGTSACVLTMTAARSVAATFESNKVLTVTLGGNGAGTVVSNPTGIMAPGVTSAAFPHGSTVTLTAAANPTTSSFTGWAGACASFGTSPECSVTMDQARSATATFTLRTYTLTLTKTGEGVGTVTSDVVGINCGTSCTTQDATFNHGQTVVLGHSAGADSQFVAWGGACSGAACSLTMTQNRTVTADFKRADKTLTVTVNGTGTVTSMDGGIDAPGDSMQAYPHGTTVTLTAAWNAASHTFVWGGACSGSLAMCTVTMDQARTVTATFTIRRFTLTVNKSGAGVGTVTSDVTGINCGTACSTQSAMYDHGQTVVLGHLAGADSEFVAWGGACSGASCSVTMTQDRTVSASFKRTDKTLTVNVTGSGTVTSMDGGINAPSDPSQTYAHGTMVTLMAAWNATSHDFVWGGACSGSLATCSVTMDQARSVTATFTLKTWTLTVTRAGVGSGTVTSTTPAGAINCGTDCTETVNHGTMVTLTAAPTGGDIFYGWSGGGCSGTSSCTTTITAATEVTATFDNCVRSTQSCTAGNFLQCDATGDFVSHVVPNGGTGGTSTTITYDGTYICPLGCHGTEPRCGDVEASNGLNEALDDDDTSPDGIDIPQDFGPRTIKSINTSNFDEANGLTVVTLDNNTPYSLPARVVPQTDAPEILVIEARSFTVPAGTTITVTGTRALAIVAHFDIYIGGTLDLSGPAGSMLGGGPGHVTTAGCVGSYASLASGGGGFYAIGGASSTGAAGGSNASIPMSLFLTPLVGGCRGGSGGLVSGGPSGGAVQLVSRTEVVLGGTALINVSGAGGLATCNTAGCTSFRATGGGAGGGVSIESPLITIDPGAVIGGRGGNGAASNSGTVGQPGAAGTTTGSSNAPASTCSGCGTGGVGGTESPPNGSAGSGTAPAIAGGGGGVGRCVTRDRFGSYVPPPGTMKIAFQGYQLPAAR